MFFAHVSSPHNCATEKARNPFAYPNVIRTMKTPKGVFMLSDAVSKVHPS